MAIGRGIRLSRQKDVDMTTGSVVMHIIRFAFPLLIGNLFQQLYNTVDTWVVGNYVSNEAFSAVGSVTPITNMMIGSFTGLASGAGVVISQNYGAGRADKVEQAVHTAVSLTLILTVVFTALGLIITPYMIGFTQLHEAAAKEATTYLTIYFAGISGLMLYNMGAGILRAIGDSQRPFYFLVVCAVLNTVLDLLFVLVFKMGVEGVALATITSQFISALLVIITLLRTNSCVKLSLKKLRLHLTILKKILLVGIPAALQMAVTAFSNVFVQSYINFFDLGLPSPDTMAGWTAYLKIDQLLFLPMQSISLATTTFVGQNLGKGQLARAKEGVTKSVIVSMAATAVMMIPVMVFAPKVVGFLNNKPEVIANGTMFLRVLTPFYLLCCFNQIYAGALRGAGDSKACMFIMLGSFVAFRQVYLFAMSRICNQIIPIAMSYPAGWLLCSFITIIYYRKVSLNKTKLVEDS
ncbi:MAG: MATE family efflux transporter [Oscillospiraceae bacterium]|nr:MATE family efflux transporter [Oscillospiraceae bacterium]